MPAETRLETRPDRIELFVRGERVAAYLPGGSAPGLLPLLVSEGRPVTQSAFPEGVSVWVGHPNVSGFAFGDGGAQTDAATQGRIRTQDFQARRGSQSVGLEHTCDWFAPDGTRLLTDVRTLRLQPGPAAGSILDIRLELRAPDDRSAHLVRCGEGLLRLSLASAFLAASGQIRNSASDYGRDLHERSAEWCACVGVVQAETVGLVILDHPTNPLHPPVWYLSAPSTLGINPGYWQDTVLAPGQSLAYRYRLHTHSGYVEAGWAAARLREFAAYTY